MRTGLEGKCLATNGFRGEQRRIPNVRNIIKKNIALFE
jgi:hypothetical protein